MPQNSYTVGLIDAWLEQHHQALKRAFCAIPSVMQRRVHVPLDVRISRAGGVGPSHPMIFRPEQLEPFLSDGAQQILLITGDGGMGKSSLAFCIARWLLDAKPDGLRRVPFLIETGLAKGESVVARAAGWLESQIPGGSGDINPAFVEALLRFRRLIPIFDGVTELQDETRTRLLRTLPSCFAIATSRSAHLYSGERHLNYIETLQVATGRIQPFILDYMRQHDREELLNDYDLMPAQTQLQRIVGGKQITPLLAQLFIEDVIANRGQGLLAGSVPELMLSYVSRVHSLSDPEQQQRTEMVIDEPTVLKALKVLALASHRQEENSQPLFRPLVFSAEMAERALGASEGMGLANLEQRRALLRYLVDLKLLHQTRVHTGELRFLLDPLADYLAALRQLELLEAEPVAARNSWDVFLGELAHRPVEDRKLMRGFLLALRDCCQELSKVSAMAMPTDTPDRLSQLGFLDPEDERYGLAQQAATKWMWELGVPSEAERRDSIAKLAALVATGAEPSEQRAVRTLATDRLGLILLDSDLSLEERIDAATVLGLIGNEVASSSLQQVMSEDNQLLRLRCAASEALGLCASLVDTKEQQRNWIMKELEKLLCSQQVDVIVGGAEDWDRIEEVLPLLQSAARGLQIAAAADLPLLGIDSGSAVPMLTLTAREEGERIRVLTEVVRVHVCQLPLPQGERLELVLLPGGLHTIGSPDDEDGRDFYESNKERCEGVNVELQRSVQLSPFAMARFPVTQAQWAAVAGLEPVEMELNPYPGFLKQKGLWECYAQPGGLPVESVSWLDCVEWLSRLNHWLAQEWATQGIIAAAPKLALPSESQWEAACRAGSGDPFHFGHTLDSSWANYDGNYVYGLGRKGANRQRTTVTGAFGLVNRWGLAEMHGQLWEWCGDVWHPDPLGGPLNGLAWEELDPALEGSLQQGMKVLRGGSWIRFPRTARAAFRYANFPGYIGTEIGLRPCCPLPAGLALNPSGQ
jgi:formylglycine-generating enzyme required for sulfatase activity